MDSVMENLRREKDRKDPEGEWEGCEARRK
jgi:hypothetical protein